MNIVLSGGEIFLLTLNSSLKLICIIHRRHELRMQEMERQCQQGLLCIRPSPAHYCATADSLRKQRGEKQGVRAAITALAASESFSPPPFPRHQQLAWHGRSCPRRQQPPGRTRRWPAAEARRSHRTYSSWRGHENPSSSGTRRGPGRARRLRGRLVGGARPEGPPALSAA